jgi:hypothetical protein
MADAREKGLDGSRTRYPPGTIKELKTFYAGKNMLRTGERINRRPFLIISGRTGKCTGRKLPGRLEDNQVSRSREKAVAGSHRDK